MKCKGKVKIFSLVVATMTDFFHLLLVHRIPVKTYSILAFLTVATMGLSNTSLNYLNYPTQVCEFHVESS